jgi:hypothetical protein
MARPSLCSLGLTDWISNNDINVNETALSKRDINLVDKFNSSLPNSTLVLDNGYNKGPLLTIAIALFGEGSFLQERIAHPEAYSNLNTSYFTADGVRMEPVNAEACIDIQPLM